MMNCWRGQGIWLTGGLGMLLTMAAFRAASSWSAETKSAAKSAAAPTGQPQYTARGELQRPTGYETWVFVGSNVGLEYGDPDAAPPKQQKKPAVLGDFHNVYINPEAYAHYAQTGKFPEKTVLVLES